MAMWQITQTTTYMDTGRDEVSYLGVFDDALRPTNNDLLEFFGVSERNNVQISSPSSGVIEAKIQYSQTQRQGWVRDRDADYDYVVVFRATRL